MMSFVLCVGCLLPVSAQTPMRQPEIKTTEMVSISTTMMTTTLSTTTTIIIPSVGTKKHNITIITTSIV